MKNLGLNKRQEAFLNRYTKGTWTYNPATGLVDVNGDFNCSSKGAKTLRGVKFGKVSGSFGCSRNDLTSLEGAPQKVSGDFNCGVNKLTSLEGAPQEVGGDFNCEWNNQLTSLEGAPQEVGGDFFCLNSHKSLTSLAGAPQKVGGHFYFSHSKNKLTSLKGAPQEVGGAFWCGTFELSKGEWNTKGWLKVLKEGSPEAQRFISTILSAKELNKEIQKDPAGMIMKLKEVWNDENFKEIRDKLVLPKGYQDDMDLVGDLDDVGF